MNMRPEFRPLTGLYEPSAIQQLTDGRFLVVEDEKAHPFSVVEIGLDGRVSCTPLEPGFFQAFEAFWKLDDLEGLAGDPEGRVYAVTSHSRNGDGEEKRSRDKLVRFRIDGNRIVEQDLSRRLKPALMAAHPALEAATEVRDVKADGGFNIEALEYSDSCLMVGFRSPLLDGRAMLATVANPDALFAEEKVSPVEVTLTTFDLQGNGMRSPAWVPSLHGYLIVAGPVARESVPFRLWYWDGNPDGHVRAVTVPGLDGFAHAEGICPARVDGQPCIVIVSDDGDRKENRHAGFLLLRPTDIRIAD